jgi:hypothetical protein
MIETAWWPPNLITARIETLLAAMARRRLDVATDTHARAGRGVLRPSRAPDVEAGGRPRLPRPLA